MILMAADAVALPTCLVTASWLIGHTELQSPAPALVVIVGVACMQFAGFYRSVIRFIGLELLFAALKCITIVSGLLLIYSLTLNATEVALREVGVFWLLALVYVVGSRTFARIVLQSGTAPGDRVLIYGAGDGGIRLASAISGRGRYLVVAFVDDNPTLHGSVINGIPIHTSAQIESLVAEYAVDRILLALPSVSRRMRRRIINRLGQLPVHVQIMPDLHDLILGQARVDDIREVEIEDLLGRDVVAPMPELLAPHIAGRSIMVTGAGGSIGSELSVQILRHAPAVLILLEVSEAALYKIDLQLQQIKRQGSLGTSIVPLIGSAHHRERVETALKTYGVNTIYHAAAHKHVPLVEHNMLEGVHNNIFGTLHTAQAAIAAGVESFVLISTDKAVKPTNVMGATKRLAELILQALDQRGSSTRFAMVRFGNVLASSGSVVPRFREQIRAGGPVTVTHPEIYRYFMTISEASSLVLQAGAMARGGEVFVLDMGEPVRIVDLAEKMIHLMGRSVRNDANPDGDIEIQFTGLRPAEKLYEELLIGDDVSGTRHPRIMQAREHLIPWPELKQILDRLWSVCQDQNCGSARALLLEAVTGYSPTQEVEDLVWRESLRKAVGADSAAGSAKITRLEPRRGPAPPLEARVPD
jgi:FlaA1/EpsC-like NDP-sugar epimerase